MEELRNQQRTGDKIAVFSLVISVIAIPMSIGIIPGILLGILAITLGIISKINYESFNLNNILGIVFGAIAIFLSSVVFLGTIMLLKEPEVLEQLSQMMEMYYSY